MKKIYLTILVLFLSGCVQDTVLLKPVNGYKALGSIESSLSEVEVKKLDGKVVKVWGYLDYSNIYTCAMNRWYFSIKSSKNGDGSDSIHVNTPANYDFAEIYQQIREMKKHDDKSKVFVTGVLHTFDASMNFSASTGIEIDVNSADDIKFK